MSESLFLPSLAAHNSPAQPSKNIEWVWQRVAFTPPSLFTDDWWCDLPRGLANAPALPHNTRWAVGQHGASLVSELGVHCRVEVTAECLRKPRAPGETARVAHWCVARSSPREVACAILEDARVVVMIVYCTREE